MRVDCQSSCPFVSLSYPTGSGERRIADTGTTSSCTATREHGKDLSTGRVFSVIRTVPQHEEPERINYASACHPAWRVNPPFAAIFRESFLAAMTTVTDSDSDVSPIG